MWGKGARNSIMKENYAHPLQCFISNFNDFFLAHNYLDNYEHAAGSEGFAL